ncbi:MAG: hypothetical protein K6F79_09055 [Saccharofermentans sp.]|nr:hypothetical protein [Saccharofermentans sp.]
MLTMLFYAAVIYVAVSMLVWCIRAAWGIAKIVAFVVLLPLLIVWLALSGLILIAIGLLILSVIFATIGAILWV